MTKRRGQMNQSALKTFLVLGSILATVIGGDLLAKQAAMPVPQATVVVMEGGGGNSAETNPSFHPDLTNAPIVKLIIPEPIASSSSSK